jgi:GTP-binding protein Era
MEKQMSKKCGYVALLGEPNAGKSTLLNACIGTKIAAVSHKPQTTRNKVLGIACEGEAQILFLDTAGLHDTAKLPAINRLMMKESFEAVKEAEILCYLIDVTKDDFAKDVHFLSLLSKNYKAKDLIVLFTKKDKLKKWEISYKEEAFKKLLKEQNLPIPLLLSLSSKVSTDVTQFKEMLIQKLPEGPWYYDEESLTDRSKIFIASELIREQIFRQLGGDVPYKCAVKIESFTTKNKSIVIDALILTESEGQKKIIIGQKGEKIKSIGIEARESLTAFLESRVTLHLYVKNKKKWRDDLSTLTDFAFLEEIKSS